MTIADAYQKASDVFRLLVEDKLTPMQARVRLEEFNVAAGLFIRCDLQYLNEAKAKHQKTAVFTAMIEDEDDYESSDYDSSEC